MQFTEAEKGKISKSQNNYDSIMFLKLKEAVIVHRALNELVSI